MHVLPITATAPEEENNEQVIGWSIFTRIEWGVCIVLLPVELFGYLVVQLVVVIERAGPPLAPPPFQIFRTGLP